MQSPGPHVPSAGGTRKFGFLRSTWVILLYYTQTHTAIGLKYFFFLLQEKALLVIQILHTRYKFEHLTRV